MKLGGLLLVLPILLALVPSSPTRAGADQEYAQRRGVKVTEYGQGHALCPVRRFVIGNVAVRGGHCYIPVVVRDSEGTFLAFADPPVRIHRDQLVRLDTPEGISLRARILYRVPMPAQTSGQTLPIPMNTLQLVRLRQVDEEVEDSNADTNGGLEITHVVSSRLTVIMTDAPLPNTGVTFVVRF
ncbi:MAG TPA: hypothetical protein VFW01_10150 [bacterium]|nr:hypothetical protein [bacterium]